MSHVEVQELEGRLSETPANKTSRNGQGRATSAKRFFPAGMQPIVGLLLLVAVFSSLRPETFPTFDNLVTVLSQGAILAVVAGGLTIALVLGEFDLSIGSVLALGGVVATKWLADGPSSFWILIALGAGVVVGAVNGILIAYLKVNAFIATLGIGAVVGGIVLAITDGIAIPVTSPGFQRLGQSKTLELPTTAVVAVAILAVLWVFLNKTEPGRRLDAVGGNTEASRLAGIRVARYRLLGMMISGLCAAGAGVLLASQLGTAYTNSGDGFLLQAFTACFLGAVTLRANEFHIVGTAVGVLIMSVAFTGLAQLGVATYWQNIAQGGILVGAVAAAAVSGRWRIKSFRRA